MGMLEGHPLGSVLELGCGSGFYSKRLNDRKCSRLVCVDFSAAMLNNLDIPGVEKIEADIQNFRSEEKFDTIICAGAAEFLQKQDGLFFNVASMLNRGGFFLILVPTLSFSGQMYRLFHQIHGVAVKLFTLNEINEFAKAAGLVITHRQRVSLFSLVVGFRLKSEMVK